MESGSSYSFQIMGLHLVGTKDWIEGTGVIVPDKIIHVIEAITNTCTMYWRRCGKGASCVFVFNAIL